MVRLFLVSLYMRERASAYRGYFNLFGATFDIFCKPGKKITECACALSETIPVRVYISEK